jgi:ribosome-binding factor A
MTQRTDRIDALLREEIGAILSRDLGDPRIGFTTVTDVETAPDLSHAQVWVSLIGQPDERTETLAALRRAMPFVRHLLGGRVRLRRVPELHVRVDDSAERGTRVLRLLADIESGSTPIEPPAGESLPTPVPRPPSEEPPAPPARRRSARPDPARRGAARTRPGRRAR